MPTALMHFSAIVFLAQTPFSEPFPWAETPPNARHDRLCADVVIDTNADGDSVDVVCRLEGEDLRSDAPAPKSILRVLAYNIERGDHLEDQLRVLTEHPDMARADILLLSEVDRGCERTGYVHVAQAYAQAFNMAYVYGVEYDEVDLGCEHGNAILSRYPIGNVRLIRFQSSSETYLIGDGEGPRREGGRMAVVADIQVGESLLRVYSTHFAASFIDSQRRAEQARELAADAAEATELGRPVVIGGDMNTHLHMLDTLSGGLLTPVHRAYRRIGLRDAHASRPFFLRSTHSKSPLVIDFIFGPAGTTANPGICRRRLCKRLSDHLPIWADILLPPH